MTIESNPARGWRLDRVSRCLAGPGDTLVPLAALEFGLLEILESKRGEVVASQSLGDSLWGEGQWSPYMLHNTVGRARKKLEACDAGAGSSIVAVPKTGYRLVSGEALDTDSPASPSETPRRTRWMGKRRWAVAAVAVAVPLFAAFAFTVWRGEQKPALSGLAEDVAPDLIRGRVIRTTGEPVSGLNVVACNGTTVDICPRTTTGESGAFELALAPGAWQVSFRRDGQGLATHVISTGTYQEVVLANEPIAEGRLATATPSGSERLRGHLSGLPNLVASGMQVTACNAHTPNPCPFGYVEADGRFELLVPNGRYVVSFTAPGESRPVLSVAMNTGEPGSFQLPK